MEKSLEELKAFLNKLFQFESQELDFGIYKILQYKRKEIKEFIDKLLVNTAREQLKVFTKEEAQIALRKLQELKNELAIEKWLDAKAKNDTTRVLIYEEDYTKLIYEYNKYSDLLRQVELADNTEQAIYNHLTLFFSRYYDKGDFISKRRFGKTEKYVVPYNGEETHFYWANHDQYYIKSSEYFQHFAFKLPQLHGTLIVNFKLTAVHTEQGNIKADDNKYFILGAGQPELNNNGLNIYFEFRALTEDEKKTFTGNGKQDILNVRAEAKLKDLLGKETAVAELWKEDDKQQTLLLRKLNHYTRKNSYDFFIHKNLKKFLEGELDFYIKSEMVKVEDLYVLESEQHFNSIRHNFKVIKCFKNIADTIIDFLSQIENFQKQLWEKKKFVLATDYVITIDKLAVWLDKTDFDDIALAVLQNKNQVAEWMQLFGWDKLPFLPTVEGLKADMHTWYRLPIDTKHFEPVFKENLLNILSARVNIEAEAGGLVIHSDNYHGLQLLKEKYQEQVKCIYIDPPYNTGGDGFLYKDGFKHSSWLAMINDRIGIARDILLENSGLFISIDDKEFCSLNSCVDETFGIDNLIEQIIWRKKSGGGQQDDFIAREHEYILFYSKNKSSFEINNRIKQKGQNGYSLFDDKKKKNYKKVKLAKWGSAALKEDRETMHFAITSPDGMQVIPYAPDGRLGRWRFGKTEIGRMIKDDDLHWEKDEDGEWFVYEKEYQPNDDEVKEIKERSIFYDISENKDGANELTSLWGIKDIFSNAKPSDLIFYLIYMASPANDIIMDFFAGSGTTANAVMSLNNIYKTDKKFILIEQSGYFYTIILPRIKKVAYSFDWKDGKPQNMGGLGVFIKYQRLEQYEEALENIAFTATAKAVQQAMEFDQYMPKYFLELETRGSKTLVNIQAMENPWGYTLKIWDGFTYDTEQCVDLVETFNYLIGLHVQKYYTWYNSTRKYVFVWGWNNELQKSLVIWRDITGWLADDFTGDREYIETKKSLFEYDYLYINGQSTVPGYQMVEDVFKTKMIPA